MDIQRTQVNSIQQFSALNAFKSNKTVKQEEDTTNNTVSNGTNTSSTPTLLDRVDVNEIREFAKSVGEFNITDEDIKYGILYGRSVIAEWLC